MIFSRFRSVGWVGAVATAALGCYLVSQRVASEPASVEALDRQILLTRVDIRKLGTEMVTRSRMPVLDRWNADVLALSAPTAAQYLHGAVQLAAFEAHAQQPRAIPVSVDVSERSEEAVVSSDGAAAPQPAVASGPVVTHAVVTRTPSADTEQPMLHRVNYMKPVDGGFQQAAPRRIALLDTALLTDLHDAARQEQFAGKHSAR